MASYDPIGALNSGTYTRVRNPNADVVSQDWRVEEKVALGFVQMNIDQKVGNIPLTGNIGIQAIHTDQTSKGLSATGTGNFAKYLPANGGAKYWDILPSMNLNFQIGEGRFLRLSASRQLARQRMSDMRAGTNFTYRPGYATSTDPFDGPWVATGGNPQLKPWRANSVDVAIEQYFRDNMGYVSLSGFMKKLKTYTYDQTVLMDFTGFPYDGLPPAIYQGKVTRPANGNGGSLKGLEATLSLPSELFTSSLKGLGVVLNGAITSSSIEPNGPGSGNTTIPGLSRKVASATVYYEHSGFSIRVTERYRSSYRGNIYTFGPRGENFRTIKGEHVLDAQVSYALQSGPMKGLTFIVQAYNLTDEPLATYEANNSRLVVDYQRYGTTYSAGVSYKF
jgi:iron complex outermembrane receptor protein